MPRNGEETQRKHKKGRQTDRHGGTLIWSPFSYFSWFLTVCFAFFEFDDFFTLPRDGGWTYKYLKETNWLTTWRLMGLNWHLNMWNFLLLRSLQLQIKYSNICPGKWTTVAFILFNCFLYFVIQPNNLLIICCILLLLFVDVIIF